jgi:peptidoglycan hydrolase-like protein with peptidoglycan-binding domain
MSSSATQPTPIQSLEGQGYDLGVNGVDGRYGNDTYDAVRAFQEDQGLPVTGEVGPDTWAALFGS